MNPFVTTMSVPEIQSLTRKSFQKELHRPANAVRKLFHKATQSWEFDRKRIQEMDRERYAEQKVEGQKSAKRGIAQGYSKEIVRKTISVERQVSGEAYKALRAHGLADMATSCAADVIDKIELDMRNFLGLSDAVSYTDNAGFTIDTTTGDGLAVFSTAHTLKNSSLTYSNVLSGAPTLADDSLEDAEDFFTYNVRDNYGQPIAMSPNTLITSNKAAMKNRATRLLKSMAPVTVEGQENLNSGLKNVNRDKYKHLVIDFDVDAFGLPDSTLSFYWYLAALGGRPEQSFQAYYVSWLSPEQSPVDVDQSAWTMSWVGRACYGLGAVSGKGIVVSKATS